MTAHDELVERIRRTQADCADSLAAADLIKELQRDKAIAQSERDELRSMHTAGCQRAYEYMGIEDDGEYRWKWVLLGIAQLADEVSDLRSARIAYAREFPFNADGEPDIGNIHANIRAVKCDLAFQKEVTDAARQHQAELLERADRFECELRLIGGANSVDMALDPTWAKRIAVAALMPNQNSPRKPIPRLKPRLVHCAASQDGECNHAKCPQLRDNEPATSGRHCPLDVHEEED